MRCASEKVIRFQRMRSRARTLRNNSLLKTVVAEKYFRTRLTHSNLICNAIAGGAVLNESEVITKSFFESTTNFEANECTAKLDQVILIFILLGTDKSLGGGTLVFRK